MINRAAIILRYKTPAVEWINDADPYEKNYRISAESANDDSTVYLIRDEDGDGEDAVELWIKRNYKVLFEKELEGWYTDPALWPEKRTLELFREWFEVECHTVLLDTVGDLIYDDGVI